jgi:hypothetical protein
VRIVTNRKLQLDKIPNPEGELLDWPTFANSINGYEIAGTCDACADLFNDDTATTITELGCALFFLSRSDRCGELITTADRRCVSYCAESGRRFSPVIWSE